MKLTVSDIKGCAAGEFEITFGLVENGRGTQAVHDAVVAQLANRRMGTACTKTVGEVAGTNKKPWRQKGTGRARAGSFRSPLWPGGGVVFGPKPRDFGKKINRGTRTLALRKALSERLKAGDVVVVDNVTLASHRTKELVGVLRALGLSGRTLVIHEGSDRNLCLAARNLPNVELTTGSELNTYQALNCDRLLFTRSALEKVGQRLK